MNSYICNRDGNALSYRTHEFRPGGQLFCWQCEQRTKNGLALLPERVDVPMAVLRQIADDNREARRPKPPRYLQVTPSRYTELTEGKDEALVEARRMKDRTRKREGKPVVLQDPRSPENLAHLDRIRPLAIQAYKARGSEVVRRFWQRRAEQLGLAV